MDGNGHVVPDAEHSTERVGTQAHVGELAHVFEALSLLLHGIVAGAKTVDLKLGVLYLNALTLALTLDELTGGADARTRGDALQGVGIDLLGIDNNLDILNGRAVVQRDEVNSFAGTMGTNPSLDRNGLTEIGACECINNSCSTTHYLL
jgi:hypothetical protein